MLLSNLFGMKQYKIFITIFVMAVLAFAPTSVHGQNWFAGHPDQHNNYDMGGDPTVNHGEDGGGYINSKVESIDGFGTLMTAQNAENYLGEQIRLSAYIKTDQVADWAGMWLRIDGPISGRPLNFQNMQNDPISGTTEWTYYEIVMNVPTNAQGLAYGIIIAGTGSAGIDGVKLEMIDVEPHWTIQETNNSSPVASIHAPNEHIVWAGADKGTFLRSIDGGQTWTKGEIAGAGSLILASIVAFDEHTAYVLGQDFRGGLCRIFKTVDGGANWEKKFEQKGGGVFYNSMAFWDEAHGIAVGDPITDHFLVITTEDSGKTWNQVPEANLPAPLPGEFGGVTGSGGTSVAVQGNGNVWFGTGNYVKNGQPLRVIKSMDWGQTWTAVNTPLSSNEEFRGIQTIAFKDSLIGFAGSTDGWGRPFQVKNSLAKTTDGGETWTLVSTFPALAPCTIAYVPSTSDLALVVTSVFGTAYSKNGGDTWLRLDDNSTFALGCAGPNAIWSAGSEGWIAKLELEPQSTDVFASAIAAIPENVLLEANYPNPFNPTTTIEFSLPSSHFSTLNIYDVIGRKVAQLVNGHLPAGVHAVSFDAGDLPSGIYLYRLTAGEVIENRKMMLVR